MRSSPRKATNAHPGERAADIARAKRSCTGAFLKPVLERRENKRKAKIEAAE